MNQAILNGDTDRKFTKVCSGNCLDLDSSEKFNFDLFSFKVLAVDCTTISIHTLITHTTPTPIRITPIFLATDVIRSAIAAAFNYWKHVDHDR